MMSALNSSRRVLVIEDNSDFVYLLCFALSQMGHEVESANNGTGGILKAREMKPDIVFCDIGLPGASGFEVARAIRKDPSLKDVYMIALTGYAGLCEMGLVLESGFNLHMPKPVSINDLMKIIDKAVVSPQA